MMIKRLGIYARNRFYDLSLNTKLFLSYFVVTIIPLLIFTNLVIGNISSTEEKKIQYSSGQAFDQAISVLNNKAKYVNNLMNLLMMDEQLQRIVNKHGPDYNTDIGQQLIDSDRLYRVLNGIEEREGILKFKLYVDGALLLSQEEDTFFSMDSVKDKGWYRQLESNRNLTMWFPASYFDYEGPSALDRIPVVRIAKDLNNLSRNLGIIRLDVSKSEIQDTLVKSRASELSDTLVLNGRNEVVATSGGQAEENADNLAVVLESSATAMNGDDWHKETIRDIEYLIRSQKVEGTDWRMVMLIPYDDIFASSMAIRYRMLLMVTVSILIAYVTAYFLARTTTRRLKVLLRLMKSAEMGELNVQAIPSHNDEIGALSKNFNSMMVKISTLAGEQFEWGQRVKTAELRVLQAQINPHFLYNTLDLINWYSHLGRNEELRDVVVALSKFYKLSLGRGEDVVSLENEIEHVKAYAAIQSQRFQGNIAFVFDFEEQLKPIPIIKITLQPIVENAILHGIMEKADKQGTIILSGRRENGDLVITVEDDGVGMDVSMLDQIRNGTFGSGTDSYGIINVKERLNRLYGEKYGVFYESERGNGTIVTIRIPA